MKTNPQLKEESPLTFWQKLFDQLLVSTSIPFEQYDFYHDLIVRHCGKNQIALIEREKKWTYDEIHHLAQTHALHWHSQGICQGEHIALILQEGIDFVVALMAALYLGLVVSPFFLDDLSFSLSRIKREIERLKPKSIITSLTDFSIETLTILWDLLASDYEQNNSLIPHSYQPGEELIPGLEVNEAYLCPLRDGVHFLALQEGTLWARPLANPSQEEPFATLAAFLAGATLLHLPKTTLIENPLLLKDEQVDVLSVSPSLLELWTNQPGAPLNRLKLWTTSPLLGNLSQWDTFVSKNSLSKIPHIKLHVQVKKGGVTLSSAPTPYQSLMPLNPSPGIPSEILNLNESGEPSSGGIGFYSLDPPLILGEVPGGYIITHSTHPLRNGAPYPTQEIEFFANQCLNIEGCMIVENRNPLDPINSLFILIVFSPLDGENQNTQAIEETLQQTIEKEVGKAFLPDQIHIFPLHPKKRNGQLDRPWVTRQYHSGFLAKKKKSPLYFQLTKLRNTLYQELVSL